MAKSKRTAGEGEVRVTIEGGDSGTADTRPSRSRSSIITSDGHTRRIYGPALEGKRHLSDDVIASIAEKISSK